jgi:hypothetical protein
MIINTKKTESGTTYHTFIMYECEYVSMDNEYEGLCIYCGEPAYGVEPDARKYECECCEKNGVYGVQELLIMGMINFQEE